MVKVSLDEKQKIDLHILRNRIASLVDRQICSRADTDTDTLAMKALTVGDESKREGQRLAHHIHLYSNVQLIAVYFLLSQDITD